MSVFRCGFPVWWRPKLLRALNEAGLRSYWNIDLGPNGEERETDSRLSNIGHIAPVVHCTPILREQLTNVPFDFGGSISLCERDSCPLIPSFSSYTFLPPMHYD